MHLEGEFKQLQTQRDATIRTLEPRIRNMRYIGACNTPAQSKSVCAM